MLRRCVCMRAPRLPEPAACRLAWFSSRSYSLSSPAKAAVAASQSSNARSCLHGLLRGRGAYARELTRLLVSASRSFPVASGVQHASVRDVPLRRLETSRLSRQQIWATMSAVLERSRSVLLARGSDNFMSDCADGRPFPPCSQLATPLP